MIRDVNFFGGGWGQRGLALGDVTLAIWTIWQGRFLAKRCSICWGSCSICLLMSTVVGGTHVYHVMRLAGSTFTWRSDHRGKWQPPWQMFSQSWGGSHGRPVQSEGPKISPATTATTCVCLIRIQHAVKTREVFKVFKTTSESKILNVDILKCYKNISSWLEKERIGIKYMHLSE